MNIRIICIYIIMPLGFVLHQDLLREEELTSEVRPHNGAPAQGPITFDIPNQREQEK